jgi:hypothetical protein
MFVNDSDHIEAIPRTRGKRAGKAAYISSIPSYHHETLLLKGTVTLTVLGP